MPRPAASRAAPAARPRRLSTRAASSAAQRSALDTLARLRAAYPDAHCDLNHEGVFQLLVATVLSAQTTDKLVNTVTPGLFAAYPDARSLAKADVADVERVIAHIGMFRQKSKNIVGLAKRLVEAFGGEVPRTLDALVTLPGVGRKTANVVLGVAFNAPEGVVVDTHIQRLSQRLGWSPHPTPEHIERDLMRIFPRADWDPLAHALIYHGRRTCDARAPACARCPVADVCPSAGNAERVGRKPPRKRRVVVDVSAKAPARAAAKTPRDGPPLVAARRPRQKGLPGVKAS